MCLKYLYSPEIHCIALASKQFNLDKFNSLPNAVAMKGDFSVVKCHECTHTNICVNFRPYGTRKCGFLSSAVLLLFFQ
jgi:ribosomal protein S27E